MQLFSIYFFFFVKQKIKTFNRKKKQKVINIAEKSDFTEITLNHNAAFETQNEKKKYGT